MDYRSSAPSESISRTLFPNMTFTVQSLDWLLLPQKTTSWPSYYFCVLGRFPIFVLTICDGKFMSWAGQAQVFSCLIKHQLRLCCKHIILHVMNIEINKLWGKKIIFHNMGEPHLISQRTYVIIELEDLTSNTNQLCYHIQCI